MLFWLRVDRGLCGLWVLSWLIVGVIGFVGFIGFRGVWGLSTVRVRAVRDRPCSLAPMLRLRGFGGKAGRPSFVTRLLSTGAVEGVTYSLDPSRYKAYAGYEAGASKTITEGLFEKKHSPHHGHGLFATVDIATGIVIGRAGDVYRDPGTDARIAGLIADINDLVYTHAMRDLPSDPAAFSHADYQRFLEKYLEFAVVDRITNIVGVLDRDEILLETRCPIKAGEEFSKYYHVHYWLNHHLNSLMDAGDRDIYDVNHPLISTILSLKHPAAMAFFRHVRSHHDIWD